MVVVTKIQNGGDGVPRRRLRRSVKIIRFLAVIILLIQILWLEVNLQVPNLMNLLQIHTWMNKM